MTITVVGTGYVGLVTAALFAKLGNSVWGLDIDKEKLEKLKNGQIPFFEPELGSLVKEGVTSGKLKFTDSYRQSVSCSDVVFICVGTPPKKNGDYDLSYVYESAKQTALALKKYAVVAIKSTVPPSTGKKVQEIISVNTAIPFDVASCPEFLREGTAVSDSFNPSRIVIGADCRKATDLLLKLHEPLKAPRIICSMVSAQLIKYAANAFLATKISFINSIAYICDKTGADIKEVSRGLGLDPRIGQSFLNAGLGYGGSCFPKDTWALISFSKRLGYDFQFLKQVDKINKDQVDYFIEKIKRLLSNTLAGKTIAILGLSFKPDTDDLRESRSTLIIKKLLAKGAKINATDPVAIENCRKILPQINYFSDPYEALKGSQALVLATEWDQYSQLDFEKIATLMKEKIIVDGRNFFDVKKLKKLGFVYEGIGVS